MIKVSLLKANYDVLLENLSPVDRGSYFSVVCPSCGKREGFVYKKGATIVCNRQNKCGFAMPVYDYLRELEELTDQDILDKCVNEKPIEVVQEKIKVEVEIPKEAKLIRNSFGVIADKVKNYLKSRKVPQEISDDFYYVFDRNSDYHGRVIIPFFEDGELVFFSARDFIGSSLRYLFPKVSNSEIVYNIDKIQEGEDVFVMEGLFDTYPIYPKVATALLTSRATKEKVEKIHNNNPRRIILVPDLDLGGVSSLKKNIETFEYLKPPSHDTEILVYIFDKERYKNICEIIENPRLSKERKQEECDRIDGPKDLSEFGATDIKIEDCISPRRLKIPEMKTFMSKPLNKEQDNNIYSVV